MTPKREKILFFVTVGVMAAGLGFIVFFKGLVEPARQARAEAQAVSQQIDDLELEIARGQNYNRRLNKWSAASFGFDDLKASEAVRAHLLNLLTRARLNTSDMMIAPVTGRRLKSGKELGWTVKTRGPIDRVIDLLYLLQNDPRLHKLEGVTWNPVPRSTDVDLNFKYSTLVLDVAPGVKPPKLLVEKADAPDPLADASRKKYALISQRDLFRPYIMRPPPPPPPPSAPPAPPVNRLTQLKLVGLPTWGGRPAVVVRDTQGNLTQSYKVGDELMGGRIVYVDYRAMPRADKPYLQSPSRVIVRVGTENWAVELGQTLSEKRKLKAEQAPEELREGKTAELQEVTDAP